MIPTRPRWLSGVCGAAFVWLVAFSVAWYCPKGRSDRLVVTVLSVGTGSATVIELPDGRTVLYDAGSANPYDVGRSTIVPFLRHRGITRIDRVYISHPNLDHFSGVPAIIDEIDTGPIVVNALFEPLSPPGSPSRHLLEMLAERDHPVETLDRSATRWELGGVAFELLWPPAEPVDTTGPVLPRTSPVLPVLSTNDSSTVLRLSYGGRSIILTGDIEQRGQQALLDRGDLRADVLLLPHHGSVRASSRAFIDAVGAHVLVRSSRERMAETLSGLKAVVGATPFYNTADVGAVQVVISRQALAVSPHPDR